MLPAESIQARYIAPDDQGVNVVCAFVREHAFKIHKVPNWGMLIGDARSAKNIPRLPRTLQGHPDVVAAYLGA